MAAGGEVQRLQIVAAKAGHGGAAHRQRIGVEQVALGRELAQALAFELGRVVVALYVHRRTVGATTVPRHARLPACGLGGHVQEFAVMREHVGFGIPVPGVHDVVRRV